MWKHFLSNLPWIIQGLFLILLWSIYFIFCAAQNLPCRGQPLCTGSTLFQYRNSKKAENHQDSDKITGSYKVTCRQKSGTDIIPTTNLCDLWGINNACELSPCTMIYMKSRNTRPEKSLRTFFVDSTHNAMIHFYKSYTSEV